MSDADEQFMRRAMALARRGLGEVEPNPMVGAVVVRDGRVLGEGFHRRFGAPHAEIEALAAVHAVGEVTRGATMYVTLEPCNHHGKTPPCSAAVIEAGITRVVAAMEDPDEQVSGRGLARLREAGVEVECGLCQAEAQDMLAAYIKLRKLARPWVICKWAQTSDGRLALPAAAGRWISCEKSRLMVHELRSCCDGICVGSGTVLADDPLLTNRSGYGRQPTRIVLDAQLRTLPASRIISSASKTTPVLIATTARALEQRAEAAGLLVREGVEFLALPADSDGRVDLDAMLIELGRRKWTRLLVEGGPIVLRSIIGEKLADELLVFVSPRTAENACEGANAMRADAVEPGAYDVPAPLPAELPRFDIRDLQAKMKLPEPTLTTVGDDTLLVFRLS